MCYINIAICIGNKVLEKNVRFTEFKLGIIITFIFLSFGEKRAVYIISCAFCLQ